MSDRPCKMAVHAHYIPCTSDLTVCLVLQPAALQLYKRGLAYFLADLLPLAGLPLLNGPNGYIIAPRALVQQQGHQVFSGQEVMQYRPPIHSSVTRTVPSPATYNTAALAPQYALPPAQSGWPHQTFGPSVYYQPAPVAVPSQPYSYTGVYPVHLYFTGAARTHNQQ